MELDYTLTYDYERLAHIQSINLSKLNSYELEKVTNYILYGKQPPKPKAHKPIKPSTTPVQHRYTTVRQKIDWEHPALSQLKEAKEIIISNITPSTPIPEAARYKRWAREISMEARIHLHSYKPPIQISPDPTPHHPIEIDDYIDYTNSFHIKHILLHYSKLRQSTQSYFNILYFDKIVDFAYKHKKLADWQIHLIKRRIDGIQLITIGRELAQEFNRVLSPSYMSQTMRTIYRAIASAAAQLELQYMDRNKPHRWRTCPSCNQTLHTSRYFWYTKRKNCIQCEREENQ